MASAELYSGFGGSAVVAEALAAEKIVTAFWRAVEGSASVEVCAAGVGVAVAVEIAEAVVTADL